MHPRATVGQVILLHLQQHISQGCMKLQLPIRRVARHLHPVIIPFRHRQIRVARAPVETQVLHPNRVVGQPNPPALQRIAARVVRILHPNVIRPRLQRIAHPHRQHRHQVAAPRIRIGPRTPADPLIPARPIGRSIRLIRPTRPIPRSAQSRRQRIPAHHHLRAPIGHSHQAHIPAQSVRGNGDSEEPPLSRELVGNTHTAARAIERSGLAGQQTAIQHKAPQRLSWGINPHIPDVRLMAGLLQQAVRAGQVHITQSGTVIIVVVVAVVPLSGHGIAPDRDLGSRHLTGERQGPAQRPELLVNVGQYVVSPPGAVRIVVSRLEDIRLRRDDGIGIGKGAGVRTGAVNGHIPAPIAQSGCARTGIGRRWHERHAGADTLRHFRKSIIPKFIGDQATAHGNTGVPAGRRQVQLPGNLLNGHLHPVGDVRKTRRGNRHIGQAAEGQICNGLLA